MRRKRKKTREQKLRNLTKKILSRNVMRIKVILMI